MVQIGKYKLDERLIKKFKKLSKKSEKINRELQMFLGADSDGNLVELTEKDAMIEDVPEERGTRFGRAFRLDMELVKATFHTHMDLPPILSPSDALSICRLTCIIAGKRDGEHVVDAYTLKDEKLRDEAIGVFGPLREEFRQIIREREFEQAQLAMSGLNPLRSDTDVARRGNENREKVVKIAEKYFDKIEIG